MTTDITQVTEAFRNLSEHENESMFEQGVVLAAAIEAGMKPADVKRECGIAAGKSKRTINDRLKVGLVFGKDHYKDMDWSTHLVAATAPDVDYRDPYTHMYARRHMDTAIKGYVDDKGVHRPHSARTLKAAIRAASGNAKPSKREVVWSKVTAHVTDLEIVALQDFGWLNVTLQLPLPDTTFGKGETVTVTITRKQPAETASADESEGAAA